MSEGALIATTAKDGRAKFQPRNRDNICFCCRSEENRENLTKCHFKKCPVSFHDSCFDSYRIGGFNPMMMVDRATKARHCSRHYCTFCYGNRLRTRAFFGKKFTCCSQCELAWHEKCIPAGCTLDENGEIICPRHRVFDRVAVHFPHCASCQKTKKEDEKPLPCRSCVRSVHISCMVKGGSITDKEHLVDNDGTITCPWCYDFGFVTENQYCMGYSKSTKLPFAYYPCVPVPNSEYPGRKEPKLGTPGYVAVKWMVWRNTITYNVLPHTKIVEMNEKDYFFINGINHKTCDETLKEPWMEAQQKLGDPMTKLQLRDDQMPTKEQNPESHVKIVNYYVQWDPEKEKLVRATIPSTSKTSKGDKYCDCKGVDGERCGPQSNCYNRECGRECPKDCGKGDDTCLNRVITTGKKCGSDVIEVFDTMICGKGVRAKKLIEPGTFIGEYYGEIISAEEATRRMKRTYMDENQEEKSYIMDIKGRYIDAKEVGGVIRYVNHSCAPNCEIRPIEVR
uniref:SET domain-containing protein n=1 Tax=Steinernema glaseri TaxID=37863 RepID=A0A1I7YCM1_9BILA